MSVTADYEYRLTHAILLPYKCLHKSCHDRRHVCLDDGLHSRGQTVLADETLVEDLSRSVADAGADESGDAGLDGARQRLWQLLFTDNLVDAHA